MSELKEVSISKASAQQRSGRAGRVQEGTCFRLYTRPVYDRLSKYSVPEMLRVPLEELCLHIMVWFLFQMCGIFFVKCNDVHALGLIFLDK